ncbi:uncharacterized protein TRIADDRAFT_23713 [Trichoplax adhaerens]|uniref:Uncharacterized protein n=1 Tax=Trichoplax adhaerens TaxID=10228 RepID=B3RVJ5_TRIAD|nr:hypothetical protein TRIADDRAFT_23713 [Trichoplax adhaerens]EDV25511.1 hypothetical protein TRIADDRAFT_23713 [Trichoplax adhaerens]|eukprot:XP_002111544.1 hypothetical protein TRIADDRAFT_23713 [Trichoplax adhaerens]
MSTAERYEYAKRRRREQLERYFAAVGNGQTTTDHNGQRSNNNNYNSRGLKITFKPDIILLDSAARNDIDEVRQLLEAKVNPNVANCDGLTALHQAVIDNCLEMCQLLINFGADVNALDKESWSPLHAACMCGHVDIAKLLIDNDADVVALNIDGLMPCDMAEDEPMVFYIDEVMESKGLNEESVMAIRNRAADQMLDDIKDAVRSGRDLEVTDEHGATALHIACANGYYDVAEYLLKNGAKVDKKDKDGWEPIHAAACWGQDGVLELLVKYGANVDAETNNYERPFDLSEDPDTKRLLTLLKRKAEQQLFARRSSSTSRPRSNSRSQAIKRLSISEKSKVSYSEAVAEAKLRSEAV